MADYQIIIKAILDKADLQTQINQVQQTINTATQGKGITLIDSKSNNAAIQAIRQEVESFVDFGKVNQIKLLGEGGNNAVVQYTNNLGDAVTKVRELNEETKQWEYHTVSVTDNIAKTRAELEKQAKQESKMAMDRDKSINKWSNDLERIKINNQEAFADPKIQQAFDDLNKKVQNFSGNLNEKTGITKDMNNFKTAVARAMAEAGNGIANFVSEMKIAIQRTIEWTVAVGGLYAVIHSLQDGIQYIKDLNKEMTNVAAVTGASKDTIASLAMQYNDLASEMAVTTLDVAKGSLEWVRAGKSAEETTELLKASTMMAKLANLDAAQSTTLLTSTLNGFKLGANDAMDVINKLVSVDNAYSTSVEEVATALQYSAAVANQAGISFDELVAYINFSVLA